LDDKPKDKNLDSEIAKRLDDLFGEGEPSSSDDDYFKADDEISKEKKSQDQDNPDEHEEVFELDEAIEDKTVEEHVPDDYPLAELKNMVLSIDWEITDEVLAGFLSQIESLKAKYKNEKIITMFLQLLGSLGVYIKTNRGNAHPKTFKILNSVFSRLEEVFLSEDMAASEKKKILQNEMSKYKQLRTEVTKKKAAKVSHQKASPAQKTEPLVEEIKKKKTAKMRDDKVQATAKEENLVFDPAAKQSHDALAVMIKDLKKFIHSEINALRQELKILQRSK